MNIQNIPDYDVEHSEVLLYHIRLLEELAREPGMFGVTELARSLEIDKSSVSRLLKTMEHAGLVAQDPTNQRYTLGMALPVLG